jgi:rare lipoprotein A (peptidoglycan hydrolase)
MSNGKILNDSALTCAIPKTTAKAWSMKFGHKVRVTNLANGRTVTLAFTDHGPAKRTGNAIDLTPAAMIALAGSKGITAGRVRVKVEREQ